MPATLSGVMLCTLGLGQDNLNKAVDHVHDLVRLLLIEVSECNNISQCVRSNYLRSNSPS